MNEGSKDREQAIDTSNSLDDSPGKDAESKKPTPKVAYSVIPFTKKMFETMEV